MDWTAEERARGYSADVRMYLTIRGDVLRIAQLGPDFLILRNTAEYPPCEAEITISIDGDERRWRVYLPDGISWVRVETRTLSP